MGAIRPYIDRIQEKVLRDACNDSMRWHCRSIAKRLQAEGTRRLFEACRRTARSRSDRPARLTKSIMASYAPPAA
jgi:hypothetical protein